MSRVALTADQQAVLDQLASQNGIGPVDPELADAVEILRTWGWITGPLPELSGAGWRHADSENRRGHPGVTDAALKQRSKHVHRRAGRFRFVSVLAGKEEERLAVNDGCVNLADVGVGALARDECRDLSLMNVDPSLWHRPATGTAPAQPSSLSIVSRADDNLVVCSFSPVVVGHQFFVGASLAWVNVVGYELESCIVAADPGVGVVAATVERSGRRRPRIRGRRSLLGRVSSWWLGGSSCWSSWWSMGGSWSQPRWWLHLRGFLHRR